MENPSGKNVKREKSVERNLQESRTDCDESKVETKMEYLTVSQSIELERSTPSSSKQKDRNHLSVRKKTKTRSPVSKTPSKIEWENILSPRLPSIERDCIFNAVPPDINSLNETHRDNYKKRLLRKMLDNSIRLIDQDDESRKDDDHARAMNIIRNFNQGVQLLSFGKKNLIVEGENLIMEAASEKLPHAMYTCAIRTFRKVVQYHYNENSDTVQLKLPAKKELKKAVRYMLEVKERFFPLPSFILGIIQLYNIHSIAKIIEAEWKNCSPWHRFFSYVLATEDFPVGGSEVSGIWINMLYSIKGYHRKYLNSFPLKYTDVLLDEDKSYLMSMVDSIKYELAIKSILEGSLTLAKVLLEDLSSRCFVDAEYSYASALLTNVFHDSQAFESKNFNKALDLLIRAVGRGHHESIVLFGTLPFRRQFDVLEKESREHIGWNCFDRLTTYVMYGKDEDFRKEAAVLVAAEYLKRDSLYVACCEEKAKLILKVSGCLHELKVLERYLQARKDAVNDALPDVLKALEEISCKLEENGELAARLLHILRQLLEALHGRELNIRKSQRLSLVLQLVLNECADIDVSTIQRRLLIPIQLLCEVLEEQVSSPSVQRNILSLIRSLFKTCFCMLKECIDSETY